jgi:exodeoxyribonuclease III
VKLISWNVNGIRAAVRNGFLQAMARVDADVICLQETKVGIDQISIELPGYGQYWNSARKRGYSGTAVFTRTEPLSVINDMGIPEHDQEGRVITVEFDRFFLVNVYTPNAQHELLRLDYRMQWDRDFLEHLIKLEEKKPVVFCGDLNAAHKEIDLKNPRANERNPGFTREERQALDRFVERDFIDTFREFNPDPGNYTWWSYRFNAREKDIGWRIDYFWISRKLRPQLKDAFILKDVTGSDHCPVGIVLNGV